MKARIKKAKEGLGLLLSGLCKEARIEPEDLACRCGVIKKAIKKLFSGRGQFAVDLINSIARVLNICFTPNQDRVNDYLSIIYPTVGMGRGRGRRQRLRTVHAFA